MEKETVDTKRAEEWLRSILEMDGYTSTATDQERIELLLSECPRLASRVEELELALGNLKAEYESTMVSEFETRSNREPYRESNSWTEAERILGDKG